ncbi:MAG: DNA-packaging protein [Victivallaceae bacterium]|nr:DNA-packaging protein [Victivallaceae bacterium]
MKKACNKTKKRAVGRPRKIWSTTVLAARAREYFNKCDSRTKKQYTKDGDEYDAPDPAPYTVEGLCSYLGIVVSTFSNWTHLDDALGERARLIKQEITANRVAGALDGRQNPGFAKFLLTNNNPDEYRDRVEVDHGITEEARSIFDACKGIGVSDDR